MATWKLNYLKDSNNIIRQAQLTVDSNSISDSDFPVSNMQHLPICKPGRVLNKASTTKLHIQFPVAVDVNVIALVAHNASENADINLNAGSSYDPSKLVDLTWRRNTIFHVFGSIQSYKYWSIDISDESNEQGFFQCGYIVMGQLSELLPGFGYDSSFNDLISVIENASEFDVPLNKYLAEQMMMTLNFAFKSDNDMSDLRQIFLDTFAYNEPVLFIPNTAGSDCIFGRFTEDSFERTFNTSSLITVSINIQDDYSGSTIQSSMPIILPKMLPQNRTFSRNSVAYYKNSNLELVSATVDEIRDYHYYNDHEYGVLLESQRTNNWTYSESWNTVWSKTKCSISSDATDEPKETPSTTADKLVENSDNDYHYLSRYLPSTPSDNHLQSFSGFFKAAERDHILLQTQNKAGSYWNSIIDLSDGSIDSQNANHNLVVEKYADDWYRVLLSFDISSGATNPRILIYLYNGGATYQGDGSSGVYIWGGQFELDVDFPSSYIATTTGTATRSSDSFSVPFTLMPQPMTIYMHMIEIGNILMPYPVVPRVWEIAEDDYSYPHIKLWWIGDYYQVNYQNEEATSVQSTVGGTISLEDNIELIATLYPNGNVRLDISINGATKIEGNVVNKSIPDIAWDNAGILKFNTPTSDGLLLFKSFKCYRGVQTLDFMRSLGP